VHLDRLRRHPRTSAQLFFAERGKIAVRELLEQGASKAAAATTAVRNKKVSRPDTPLNASETGMVFRVVLSDNARVPKEPRQLPPGRHGLSRSFVAKNQRNRILTAVALVADEKSYSTMTVEDIIVAAGVSRRTFYEQFDNKESAFLAAYDEVVARLLARVEEAVDSEQVLVERVRAGIDAFLEFVASDPAIARVCIVEVLAAGPEAVSRRRKAMSSFAQLMERTASMPDGPRAAPSLTAETLVGGLYEVVYTRVLRGESSELPGLLPDLVYSALLPYLGPEAAAMERGRLAGTQAA
jgi:AcrR family transcriptional regulator